MKFALILTLIFTLSCDRPKKNGGGVVDSGGGGDFIYNSEEEVLAAIGEVWHKTTTDWLFSPAKIARNLLEMKTNLTHEEKISKSILDKIFSGGVDYITKKELKLKTDGYCRGPHDRNYLASVTKLNRTGEICFSVYGLMRVPSGSITHDLYGLLAHEAAHLNGFGETEARILQRFILKNILKILMLTQDDARYNFLKQVREHRTSHWVRLIAYDIFTEEYVTGVAELSQRIRGLFPLDRFDIHRGVPNPQMQEHIRERTSAVGSEIYLFAEEILDGLKKGPMVVSPRHLQHMRNLALAIIEVEKLLGVYFFGNIQLEATNVIRSPEDWDRERLRILTVTEPEMLSHTDKRLQLMCPVPQPQTELEKLLFNRRAKFEPCRDN